MSTTRAVSVPTENQYRAMFTQAAGPLSKAKGQLARYAFQDAINTLQRAAKNDPFGAHNPWLVAEVARTYRAARKRLIELGGETRARDAIELYNNAAQKYSDAAEKRFHQALENLPARSGVRATLYAGIASLYLDFFDLFGEDSGMQMAIFAAKKSNDMVPNETATRIIMALSERGVSWSEETQRQFDDRHKKLVRVPSGLAVSTPALVAVPQAALASA